jgi:hypothetical protein
MSPCSFSTFLETQCVVPVFVSVLLLSVIKQGKSWQVNWPVEPHAHVRAIALSVDTPAMMTAAAANKLTILA